MTLDTFAAGDLKLSRCRELMKSIKVCEYSSLMSFLDDLML